MNKSSIIFFGLFLVVCLSKSYGQDFNIESSSHIQEWLDRWEAKSGILKNDLFLDFQSLPRQKVNDYLTKIQNSDSFKISLNLSKSDVFWMNYLRNELSEYQDSAISKKPIFNNFYTYKNALYTVKDKDFCLIVNPVFAFEQGRGNNHNQIFRNTKGFEIKGNLSNKLGFYTYLTDNQTLNANYVNDYAAQYHTLPNEGYHKYTTLRKNDFINARAYITFSPIKQIRMQFGNDKFVIGNGYRSLIMSDFAKDFLSLRINTQFWRLNYQNIFAEFIDVTNTGGVGTVYNRKYGAFHSLSLDVTKWWNVGVMEGILFFNNNQRQGFELNYLNPIMFYRSAEQNLNSVDNTLIGANSYILPAKNIKIYGQLLLDEFKISELKHDKGWAGNKYAIQAGIKYFDVFGLPNVDLQVEGNYVRPYVYSSDTSLQSYTNFNQPIGHPAGANLEEAIGILKINSFPKLNLSFKGVYRIQGKDSLMRYNGENPNLNYQAILKSHPYGNLMLQGIKTKVIYLEAKATYMIKHNLFLDFSFIVRKEKNDFINKNDMIFNGCVRYNFLTQNFVF